VHKYPPHSDVENNLVAKRLNWKSEIGNRKSEIELRPQGEKVFRNELKRIILHK